MPLARRTAPAAFACYTGSDGESAFRLARDLRANDIAAWIDQAEIPSGATWDLEIDHALLNAGMVLVVLATDPCERGNVL